MFYLSAKLYEVLNMSHGGGESGRVHEKSEHAKRKSGASGDEFVQAISKIAVAQICESAGFQTFQQSALEILSDITIQYMRNLGKLAQSFANSAGRTKGNALDVIQFKDWKSWVLHRGLLMLLILIIVLQVQVQLQNLLSILVK
ncbi:hypothetical protein MANES_02G056001v8 [Manihot esculenta]|uniref:Uncharacterized protein n=1 Tax=Manihot esculenta TaxID=3983 RepID=A0ACB7I5F8_MANES|nr:hypothetical protein MANES_02G056001v8 [Manihot esculenta]